jgi:hypothetical protein
LYFLDSLLDQTLSIGSSDMPYVAYITRDLSLVVGKVVPDTREGVLNLKAARQVRFIKIGRQFGWNGLLTRVADTGQLAD